MITKQKRPKNRAGFTQVAMTSLSILASKEREREREREREEGKKKGTLRGGRSVV